MNKEMVKKEKNDVNYAKFTEHIATPLIQKRNRLNRTALDHIAVDDGQ